MDQLPAAAALVPIVVGLVQVLKQIGLPHRWGAIAAITLGLCAAVGAQLATAFGFQPYYLSLIDGMLIGLTAAGLYSVARAAAPKPGTVAQGRPNVAPQEP